MSPQYMLELMFIMAFLCRLFLRSLKVLRVCLKASTTTKAKDVLCLMMLYTYQMNRGKECYSCSGIVWMK